MICWAVSGSFRLLYHGLSMFWNGSGNPSTDGNILIRIEEYAMFSFKDYLVFFTPTFFNTVMQSSFLVRDESRKMNASVWREWRDSFQ